MVTNDERREVAARLREKHRECTSPLLMEPQDVDMQALGYLRDLESCVPDGESLFTVLADLIEPSPTCEFWDAEEQECYSVRTVRPVDRDALLALADEMEKGVPLPGGAERHGRAIRAAQEEEEE